MKKRILGSLCLLLLVGLVGCQDMMNTPTKRVEEYLGKYQIMDQDVLEQLEHIIDEDETLTKDQKRDYQALMEKQYQNLSYKIKDETIDGNDATVTVEISVFDYQSAISKATNYIEKNQDKFETDGKKDISKEMDYKIKQMESVTDKISYTLTFSVQKDQKEKRWVLEQLEDDTILKLHGLYNPEN